MSTLFKKCVIISSIVTIPTVFGPAGIVLSVLVGRAGVSMFHGNLIMQCAVVIGMILTFVLPVLFIASLIYMVCIFFIRMMKDDEPKPEVIHHAIPTVYRKSKTTVPDSNIIDGEWTEVN